MAILLAPYTGKVYSRQHLNNIERPEYGYRRCKKYRAAPALWRAYQALLVEIAERLALTGRRLRVRVYKCSWRLELHATCRACQRPFALTRAGLVRCARCRKASKR